MQHEVSAAQDHQADGTGGHKKEKEEQHKVLLPRVTKGMEQEGINKRRIRWPS
jgi:hypothetical protein